MPMHRSFAHILTALTVMTASLCGSQWAFGQSIDMKIYLPKEDKPEELTEVPEGDVRIREFFNRARCECKSEFGVQFSIPNLDSVPSGRPIEIWLGTSCDDELLQSMNCGENPIKVFGDRNALNNPKIEPIAINALANPLMGECGDTEVLHRVYALVDSEGDGTYEVSDSIEIKVALNPLPTLEPAEPRATLKNGEIEAHGSEGGFIVNWKLPDSRQSDFKSYQVLCAKVSDGSPGLLSPSNDPLYETALSVCDQVTGDQTDIETLDKAFICGQQMAPANSIRVTGLSNNESYKVIWVAIDEAKNPTVVSFSAEVTPEPVIDFWEDYQENGGDAVGGYCFVATAAYGDYSHPHVVVLREFRDRVMLTNPIGRALVATYYWASPPIANIIAKSAALRWIVRVLLAPIVAFAGMWVFSGLMGKLALIISMMLGLGLGRRLWMRRRQRHQRKLSKPNLGSQNSSQSGKRRHRVAVATTIGLLTLIGLSRIASAQQEYLDELYEDESHFGEDPEAIQWNAELRFAPFVPSVDDEFSGSGEGPFARMFGEGPMLMTQVTVDRFFLWPQGQLGVSFSLGFLTTGADAYEYDKDQPDKIKRSENGKPVRVGGERTDFRVYPLSVSAVYRYTNLDDQFSIPLVPYGRLGIAYSLWSVSRPDGATSEVSTTDCMVEDPDRKCEGNLGRGGSLGYVASLGLAVRAERIDPDAAIGLRNELGVEHAGFFVEANLSKVDGFGSKKRLSVGDFAWFAGINFEF